MPKNKPSIRRPGVLTVNKMKKAVRPLFKRTGIGKAVLFGFFAKGTAGKKSDIDILIIKQTRRRFLDRFSEFSELYDIFKGYAVDMLFILPKNWIETQKGPL